MLRAASLVLVLASGLAACGASRDRGPAWPKPSPGETDGGESLAPRQASSIAAIEDAADSTPSAAPASPAASAATPASASGTRSDKPAEGAPPAKDPDVLTTEEIIIEIED